MGFFSKSHLKINPLQRKRIMQFKDNNVSWYALWALVILCGVSFLCPLIANEKPLCVYYNKQFYFPILKAYPETQFGGVLKTQADYTDTAVKHLIQQKGWALYAPIPFSPDTIDENITDNVPSRPSLRHLLGTDDQGTDVLSRLLYGMRTSLFFGFILTFVSLFFGVSIGAIQGYFGAKTDLLLQRFTEIWSGLPVLYLLIIMSSLVTPNFWWLLSIMSLFNWMILANVVRSEFFKTRAMDYVIAAQAMGVSTFTIIKSHILPNALTSTITYIPFILNISIGTLTALDFLGFGLPPGEPSLGALVLQAKNNPHAPWLRLIAFISIGSLLAILTFIGEGIRNAFDPNFQKNFT